MGINIRISIGRIFSSVATWYRNYWEKWYQLTFSPSHLIVLWNTVHGPYNEIHLSTNIYLTLLSISSYCTVEEWDGTVSFHIYIPCLIVHPTLLHHGNHGQYSEV